MRRSGPAARQSEVIRDIYDSAKGDMEEVSGPCSVREWGPHITWGST